MYLLEKWMSYVDRAGKTQNELPKFLVMLTMLLERHISMGITNVEDIALAISKEKDYDIVFKSVIGVEVPHIIYEIERHITRVRFYHSNSAMDVAYKNLVK